MAVAIVTDSCHYLPRELAARIGLHEVSLYVHRDGGAVRESEITDYDAYFESLAASPNLPTTSQPSIGDFLAVYEPLLAAGDEIVSIHLSGGLSGTVHSAQQAREQLGERAAAGAGRRLPDRMRGRGADVDGGGGRHQRRAVMPPPPPRGRSRRGRRWDSCSRSTRSSTCVEAGASVARRRGLARR